MNPHYVLVFMYTAPFIQCHTMCIVRVFIKLMSRFLSLLIHARHCGFKCSLYSQARLRLLANNQQGIVMFVMQIDLLFQNHSPQHRLALTTSQIV